MRTLTLFLLAATLMAQAPALEPVASPKELMDAMIIPSSNELFNAGLESEPTDEDWVMLRNQALVLIESANLLMMPGRAVDNGVWMDASKRMLEAGKKALAATEAKDLDLLSIDVGSEILEACTACHEVYLK